MKLVHVKGAEGQMYIVNLESNALCYALELPGRIELHYLGDKILTIQGTLSGIFGNWIDPLGEFAGNKPPTADSPSVAMIDSAQEDLSLEEEPDLDPVTSGSTGSEGSVDVFKSDSAI